MFSHTFPKVTVLEDINAILIPDGKNIMIKAGEIIYIQQVLGGMFTCQTDDGQLVRIDGKDAQSIGQPIPNERQLVTLEDVKTKSLETCINEQLKTCYDPEIPVNIVDLGLVYSVEIKEDPENSSHSIVKIEMTLTAPGCGMGEVIKSDVEKKIRDIPKVKYVLVDLVFDPAWDSSMMTDSAKLTLGLY